MARQGEASRRAAREGLLAERAARNKPRMGNLPWTWSVGPFGRCYSLNGSWYLRAGYPAPIRETSNRARRVVQAPPPA